MNHDFTPYNQLRPRFNSNIPRRSRPVIRDYGPRPLTLNIKEATMKNSNFRTTLWTGCHLQVTLMCIPVDEEIGLELHPEVDQFLQIECGQGVVIMGDRKDRMHFHDKINSGCAIMIPAGKWHNIINTGSVPLKLYSVYAPPQHPHGTVHRTKAEAEKEEA